MKSTTKFVYAYLVPLAILTALFFALRWIPVQMALAWLVPLAAETLPATIPPLQIILAIGIVVGGLFAMFILSMTRYLHRGVISRQRLKVLEDKRKRGHDSIAASVFDLSAVAIDEDYVSEEATDAGCALERDPRLAVLITTLWAKPEFHKFLQRLFDADGGEGRMLSPDIRHELAFLRNLYTDQRRIFARPVRATKRSRPTAHAHGEGARWRGVACLMLFMAALLVPLP